MDLDCFAGSRMKYFVCPYVQRFIQPVKKRRERHVPEKEIEEISLNGLDDIE